jgi:exopolysaccharide biosynthesis polyprenyl glycosylphosphotransferase
VIATKSANTDSVADGHTSYKWRTLDAANVISNLISVIDALCIIFGAVFASWLLNYEIPSSAFSVPFAGSLVVTLALLTKTKCNSPFEMVGISALIRFISRLGSMLLLLACAVRVLGEREAGIYIWLATLFFVICAILVLQRSVVAPVVRRAFRSGRISRNIVIYGAGAEGRRVAGEFLRDRDPTLRLVAIVDSRCDRVPSAIEGIPVYRGVTSLPEILGRVRCQDLVIALPRGASSRVQALRDIVGGLPIGVRLAEVSLSGTATGLSLISGVPLVHLADEPLGGSQRLRKRLIDCTVSLILLFLLAPLMACIGIAVKLGSSGPIFFRQRREGIGKTEFDVLKFRTMFQDQCDPLCVQQASVLDPRVTPVGRFLRSTGLDELPQLLNVLRGDMSLVGPRPHAVGMFIHGHRTADLVREYQRRQAVKPGITGWAQINANRGPIDSIAMLRSRVALDLFYIQHRSDLLDLKIVVFTAIQLLKDAAISPGKCALARIVRRRSGESGEYEVGRKFVQSSSKEDELDAPQAAEVAARR